MKKKRQRRNPGLSSQIPFTGHTGAEMLALLAGGVVVQSANGLLAKASPSIAQMLGNIPVIGSVLPAGILGVGLNILKMPALKTLGEGILSAVFVKIAMDNTSKILPAAPAATAAAAPVAGVLAYPGMRGVDARRIGASEFDTMSGVRSYPAMAGVVQRAQASDFGRGYRPDYYEQAADYGSVPEGLSGLDDNEFNGAQGGQLG